MRTEVHRNFQTHPDLTILVHLLALWELLPACDAHQKRSAECELVVLCLQVGLYRHEPSKLQRWLPMEGVSMQLDWLLGRGLKRLRP